MIKLFHLSQYFWNSKFKLLSSIIDFLIFVLVGADVKGRTLISKSATFAHHGLGVVVHPSSVIGDSCIINAKVTLGNGYRTRSNILARRSMRVRLRSGSV